MGNITSAHFIVRCLINASRQPSVSSSHMAAACGVLNSSISLSSVFGGLTLSLLRHLFSCQTPQKHLNKIMSHRFPLKEIAFQAGLSLATVDRAIHRRRHVRQSTIDRVELAIRELERQYTFWPKEDVSSSTLWCMPPSRFTTAIRDAFEAEFPAMRPASFRARFHFAQTMNDADIQQIIRAIRRAAPMEFGETAEAPTVRIW